MSMDKYVIDMKIQIILLLLLLSYIKCDIFDIIRSGDINKLSDIISNNNININERERDTLQTPLMAATLAGQSEAVKLLLRYNADPSIGEKMGYTPMHGCGFQGRADVCKILINHGLNANDMHKDGYTPVHRACWGSEKRHSETVKVLIDIGSVDVNTLSRNGKTPLDLALKSRNKRTIKILKHRGGRTSNDVKEL